MFPGFQEKAHDTITPRIHGGQIPISLAAALMVSAALLGMRSR